MIARLAPALLLLGISALAPAQNHTTRDAAWRATIRHQILIDHPLPALNAKTWSTFQATDGVTAERITYSTANGMLVPAILYRPNRAKTHTLPGIVVVNGHGSDKYGWYAFWSGMAMARAGAVVITYDPIGEGERNIDRKSRAGSHDKILPTPDSGPRLAGLMQTDLANAVTLLAGRPEVDAKRIAVVGYSLGAWVTFLAGALDTRIHATVLSGGGTYDGPDESFDQGKLPCQAAPWHALSVLGDRTTILYALNQERGPMFIMNGAADKVVFIPTHGPEWFNSVKEKTIAINGTSRNIFETIFYPGISHRTSWVNADGMAWLNSQIHFANWKGKSAAEIAAMPTTHISTWITANHVDISKNYFPEDREGGLDAVGTNLPGLTREQLTVLPDADWQRLKSQLIYEAWAEKITKP